MGQSPGRSILLTGEQHLLASWSCALWLEQPGVRVTRAVAGADAVDLAELSQSVERLVAGRGRVGTMDRLRFIVLDESPDGLETGRHRESFDEVWCLGGPGRSSNPWGGSRTGEVRVSVPPLVAGWSIPLEAASSPVTRFLALLENQLDEVASRCLGYFAHRPLRLRVDPRRRLWVASAETVAAELVAAARDGSVPEIRHHRIRGLATTAAELFGTIGTVYGLHIRLEPDFGGATTVDRAFADRLGELGDLFQPAGDAAGDDAGNDGPGACDPALLETWIAGARRARPAAWVANRGEGRAGPGPSATPGVLVVGRGEPPVVIVNALGQGIEPWRRLLAVLARRRRVVLWHPPLRGPWSVEDGRPLGRAVDALAAMLAEQNARPCHLVGWCTGPKMVLELHRRDPGVARSLVFLNGTFHRLDERDPAATSYEAQLERLARTIDAHPGVASTMGEYFATVVEREAAELARDLARYPAAEGLAERLLAAVPETLHGAVVAPFGEQERLIAYARGVLDFLRSDAGSDGLAEVSVPLLSVSGPFDAVASPEVARRVAGRVPGGRHVELAGAGHYAIHDRAVEVAELLEGFFRGVEAGLGSQGAQPSPRRRVRCT